MYTEENYERSSLTVDMYYLKSQEKKRNVQTGT